MPHLLGCTTPGDGTESTPGIEPCHVRYSTQRATGIVSSFHGIKDIYILSHMFSISMNEMQKWVTNYDRLRFNPITPKESWISYRGYALERDFTDISARAAYELG